MKNPAGKKASYTAGKRGRTKKECLARQLKKRRSLCLRAREEQPIEVACKSAEQGGAWLSPYKSKVALTKPIHTEIFALKRADGCSQSGR